MVTWKYDHHTTFKKGKFVDYINKQIVYPEIAKKSQLEGVVIVEFIIEIDGTKLPTKKK